MRKHLTFALILFILPSLSIGQISDGSNKLDIIHINVGEGDATLILSPMQNGSRIAVLIDTGGYGQKDSGKIIYNFLKDIKIKNIDYLILSHYAEDHLGGVVAGLGLGSSFILGPDGAPGRAGHDDDENGIIDWQDNNRHIPDPGEVGVFDDVPVKHFIDPGPSTLLTVKNKEWYQAYYQFVSAMQRSRRAKRTEIRTKSHINKFKLELGGGAQLLCLVSNGYVRDVAGKVARVTTAQEHSMGFILIYKHFTYLTCGDLSGRIWKNSDAQVEGWVGRYLFRYRFTPIDVLKVSQHGSNSTSSSAFLSMVKPRIAIIFSKGNNRQESTHPGTLKRLAHFGAWFIYQSNRVSQTPPIEEYVRNRLKIINGHIYMMTDGKFLHLTPGGRIINCQ